MNYVVLTEIFAGVQNFEPLHYFNKHNPSKQLFPNNSIFLPFI